MKSSSFRKKNYLIFLKKIRLKSIFFRTFAYIFTLVKLLPLFIITHDWNILQTNGISHYLTELTLCPILIRLNNLELSLIFLLLFILLSVIPFIILIKYYIQFKKYDVFLFSSKTSFKVSVWLLYLFPYLLNQYIFTICVFNFFMRQHHPNVDFALFIIIIIIQIIFIVFCLGISVVLSVLSMGSYYTTSKVLVSKVGGIEIKWICFAICQGIIELEYLMEFRTIIYIKSAIRIIYILYSLVYLFNLSSTFISQFTLSNIILNMCFFSCIIEFCVMHTFNDDLILLSSDAMFIVLKLILEIILAVISNTLITYKEEKRILNVFTSQNDGESQSTSVKNIGYSILGKFILGFSGLTFNKKYTQMTIKLLNKFQTFFMLHKENCVHQKNCFCKRHKTEEIKKNFDNFYYLNESNPKKIEFSFKEFCPALFDYVESFLTNELNKVSSNNNGDLILLLIFFHMECNKNYNMAYYYLDKYMHTYQYKNSIIIKIQTELIKNRLKCFNKLFIRQNKLKAENNSEEGIYSINQENMKLHFKNILCFIKIEDEINNSFQAYYECLVKTTLNDEGKESFQERIENTSKSLKISRDNIIYYINSFFQTNNEKCLNFQICSKISIYFKYFYGKIPKNLRFTFLPLTNFYNLSKYQINDNILLLRLSNSKLVEINIEYVSDSLLVELGYSSHLENKLDNLNDIIPQRYYEIYNKYLVDNILKGIQNVHISYFLLRDKFHFLRIYHMDSHIIMTDKYVSLYTKFQTVNKSNNCFVVLNNIGNIIGMSQEFNNTFYLNMNIINKLQIVLFNDLLGINFEEQNINKTITIDTIKFYENINLLSANMVFENNQEQYAFIYQHAREAISKIKKNPLASIIQTLEIQLMPFSLTKDNQNELYFLVYFSIQNKNNVNILNQILDNKYSSEYSCKEMNLRKNKDILTQKLEKGIGILPSGKTKDREKKELQSMTKLSKDQNDIKIKLNLIREFGFAVLHHIYEISQKIIDEVSFINKKIQFNNDVSSPENSQNRNKINYTKNKLFFQMKLFICVFIFFFFLTFFVEIYSNCLYNDILVIVDIQVYCIIAKKIINSLATSIIGMVLIQNNIQTGTIDYGFNYDYQANIRLLQGRIEDYLENFKKFRETYYGNTFQSFSHLDLIKNYLQNDIDFISMDVDYNSTTEKQTLYDIFNYLHIRLKQLIDQELNPLYFNSTDGNFRCKLCDEEDIKINNSNDLAADSICVFVLRNFLTRMNYPLIEIINYLEELIVQNKQKATNFILIMNIFNILIILFLLLYQTLVYYNLSTELFVKWFLNACNLRYFSIILVQKTQILKNAIELATINSITSLTMTKFKIANAKEENEILQSKINSIEEDLQFCITPFHVLIEYKDWENLINLNGEAKWQTNSAFLTDNTKNNNKQESLKRPLTQTKEELRKKTKFQSTQFNKKLNFGQIKKLNSTNAASQNISSINNLTSDHFIKKSSTQQDNQMQPPNNMKEKKFTITIHRSARVVLIMAFILSAIVISFIHYFISKMLFDLLEKFSFYESVTLLRTNYFHEVFLCYQMAIINNSPLHYEYKSSGFLNHTKQTYYINSFTSHDVFNETLTRYKTLSEEYEDIISDTSKSAFQKNLIEFEMQVRKTDACEEIANFLYENKGILSIKLFVSLNNFDFETLVQNCKKIGGGYNNKGIHTAFNSLVNYVSDNYRDFIMKGNERDEIYNYNAFQESTIQTYQIETNRMLELLFFNYQIAMLMDYNTRHKNLKFLNDIYLICVIVFLLFLFWIYLDKFTKFYVRMDNSIEKVRSIVISTIIY